MAFLTKKIDFYDTRGVRQSAVYNTDTDIWNFELVFDSISTGLFSTQQLHIFENVINILNGENKKSLLSPMTNDGESLKFKFKKTSFENFFLYRIEYSPELKDYFVKSVNSDKTIFDLQTESPKMHIKAADEANFVNGTQTLAKGEIYPGIKKIVDSLTYPLQSTTDVASSSLVTTESESFVNSDDTREVLIYDDSIDTITLDIGFLSEVEGEFQEILEIYLTDGTTDTLIAEVNLFCEAIAEDTRLTTILENFGQTLDVEDSLVFRETDVNDDKSNHDVLNRKKKELILEYSNIIPYIGAYKGLINALKFYGYNDLRIKEWWLNLDTEQKHYYEIDKDTYKTLTGQDDVFGEGNRLKRTGKFSLFYDIFKLTGEVDQYGIPEIEKSFPYSQNEVLIKLYGLKTLFKRKYLPLSTRIVDITGEGIVFDRISSQTWNNHLEINEVNGIDLDFKIEATPTYAIMNNLRFTTSTVPKRTLSDLASTKLTDIASMGLEHINREYFYKDTDDRKSYAKVTLTNKTFDARTLADMAFVLEDAENISIELAQSFPVYEMQYDIICNEGKGYRQRIFGTPSELETIELELDVSGNYDVIVKTWDVYNNICVQRLSNVFLVELPEPRISGIWNETNSYDTIEEASHLIASESLIDFTNAREVKTTIEDLENITLDALDPANYLQQNIMAGTYSSTISNIDRDNQYVDIPTESLNRVEDLEEQTYLTIYSNWNQKEIYPKDIISADDTSGKLRVSTSEIPLIGDTLEVFEFIEVSYGSLTITDKTIVYNTAIDFDENLRFYLYNSSDGDVAYLEIKSHYIDVRNNKTTITVLDPDGLLAKSYTSAFFMQKPISYEVSGVTKISTSKYDITLTSTVDMNLDDIQDKLDSSIDMRCWWNLTGGRYSIPIRKYEDLLNGTTRIWVYDNERELFRITKNFLCLFAEYDINYAENRLSKTTLTIDDLSDALVEDVEDMEIDETELHHSSLPGFVIKDIQAGSMIKIGDSNSWFQFSSACTGNVTAAIEELRSSDRDDLKQYEYVINTDLNQIHAVAKSYGEELLDVIEFDNVVVEPRVNPRYSCNYQLPIVMKQESNYSLGSTNNRMNWNPLLREWIYQGETFEIEQAKADSDLYLDDDLVGNFRRHYGYAMNGNFRWYNTRGSEDTIQIPTYKLIYFQGDASDVIGKSKYSWKFFNDNTGKIVGEIEGEFVSYFFTDEGNYSVELTVTDWNGNVVSRKKSGFINVSGEYEKIR